MFAEQPMSNPLTPTWWVEQLDAVHGFPSARDTLAARPCHGVSRFYDGGKEFKKESWIKPA